MAGEVNTLNRYGVTRAYPRGRASICFLAPPLPEQILGIDEALVLAAYIVAIVADEARWRHVLEAVQEA